MGKILREKKCYKQMMMLCSSLSEFASPPLHCSCIILVSPRSAADPRAGSAVCQGVASHRTEEASSLWLIRAMVLKVSLVCPALSSLTSLSDISSVSVLSSLRRLSDISGLSRSVQSNESV